VGYFYGVRELGIQKEKIGILRIHSTSHDKKLLGGGSAGGGRGGLPSGVGWWGGWRVCWGGAKGRGWGG